GRSHESSSIDIVCLLLSYALLTQPKSSGTLSALPFLVKESLGRKRLHQQFGVDFNKIFTLAINQ
ncbi:hypothetical protein L195_g003889, partial [Trifolium pratense]